MGSLDKRLVAIAAIALITAIAFGGLTSGRETTAHAQEAPRVPVTTFTTFENEMRRREVRALEAQARQTERLVRVIERLDSRCR